MTNMTKTKRSKRSIYFIIITALILMGCAFAAVMAHPKADSVKAEEFDPTGWNKIEIEADFINGENPQPADFFWKVDDGCLYLHSDADIKEEYLNREDDSPIGNHNTRPWVADQTIRESIKSANVTGKLTMLPVRTFQNYRSNLPNLKKVDLSECTDLKNIGKWAFLESSVEEIIWPENGAEKLKQIGKEAFMSCSNLETIDFTGYGELVSVGEGAFALSNNSNKNPLMRVSFRDCSKLESIGSNAFQNHYYIEEYDLQGTKLINVDHQNPLWFDNAHLKTLYIPGTVENKTLNLEGINTLELVVIDGKEEDWNVTTKSGVTVIYLDSDEPKTNLKIAALNGEKNYDAEALEGKDLREDGKNYKIQEGSLKEGDKIDINEVQISSSRTFVGKCANVIQLVIIRDSSSGKIVNDEYKIEYVPGELEVKPRPLTITASSAEKDYDGSPLTKDEYTASSNLAIGDELKSVKVTGSQTEPGKSDNVPSKALIKNEGGREVTDCYDINYVNGSLTVNPLITVKKVLEGLPAGTDVPFGFVATAKDAQGQKYTKGIYDENGQYEFKVSPVDAEGKSFMAPLGGSVVIKEKAKDYDYTTKAKSGDVEIAGQTFTISDTDKNQTVTFTNTKKPICKIGNTEYTSLRAAVSAAGDGDSIEMLVNYEMLAYDSVTIPSGKNITLTTADNAKDEDRNPIKTAWIKRGDDSFNDSPMFDVKSGAKMSIENIILDGNKVEAAAPVINCAGTLDMKPASGEGKETKIHNAVSTAKGAAVYVENNGVFNMSGGIISDNTGKDGNVGAVNFKDATAGLNFSYDAVVKNNKDINGDKKNVVLDADTDRVLNFNNISENADISICATPTAIYEKRGITGQQFGRFTGSNDHLDKIKNDKNSLFGIQKSEGSDILIWDGFICRLVNTTDLNNPVEIGKYNAIKKAVEVAEVAGYTTARIEMLTDYTIPSDDKVEIGNGDHKVDFTITTAPDYDLIETGKTKATIERKTGQFTSFFNIPDGGNTLSITLKDLILDGDNVRASQSDGGGALFAKKANVLIDGVEFYGFEAKDGGAIVTTGPEMTITGCKFDTCRSDNTNNDHGGGGAVKTEAIKVVCEDTEFIDCVAVSQGGAFYHDTTSTSSTSEISNCIFRNCSTVNGSAGAIELDSNNVKVTNCDFFDCHSQKKSAGALNVYSIRNGQSASTGTLAEITDCNFYGCTSSRTVNNTYGGAAKLNAHTNTVIGCFFGDSTTNPGVHTNGNKGGAIGFINTRDDCVSNVSDCIFENCNSNNHGGAIYVEKGQLNIDNTTITGCSATNQYGGAIYIGNTNGKIYFNGGDGDKPGIEISGCSSKVGSAVNGKDNSKFFFEGNVKIYENFDSKGNRRNVELNQTGYNDQRINTSGSGLGSEAKIGIYCLDGNPYNNHGKLGKLFGTQGSDDSGRYLDKFVNDRNEMLYGVNAPNNKIKWDAVICKITDAQGNLLYKYEGGAYQEAKYFYSIDSATNGALETGFNEYGSKNFFYKDGSAATQACIKMVVPKYALPRANTINVPAGKSVIFTTAGENDADYRYVGDKGTVSTIYRGECNASMFTSAGADTQFTITNITLDGNMDSGTPKVVSVDGGLVKVTNGKLIIGKSTSDKITLRNSDITSGDGYSAGRGGAAFIDAAAQLEVNGATITGNRAAKAGGIYVNAKGSKQQTDPVEDNPSVKMTSGNITDNVATVYGGGVYIGDCRKAAISNVTLAGNHALGTAAVTAAEASSRPQRDNGNGGALYADIRTDIQLTDCTVGTKAKPNTALRSGGGIFLYSHPSYTADYDSAKVTVQRGSVSYNTAAYGGGIATKQRSLIYIRNAQIAYNKAVKNTSASAAIYAGYNGNGGGILTEPNSILDMTGGAIKGNSATGTGGGFYVDSTWQTSRQSVLNGTLVGTRDEDKPEDANTAVKGAGGYAKNITMVNAVITGNNITGESIKDGGGLVIATLLTLGESGEGKTDTSTIYGNKTSDGKNSNLILPLNKENNIDVNTRSDHTEGIRLLCRKTSGKIYVTNPGDCYTQFGFAGRGYIDATEDNYESVRWSDAIFAADDESDMFGIIKKDGSAYNLYWWKLPIAKITNGRGTLLYKDADCTIPAVYTALYPYSSTPTAVMRDYGYAFATLNNSQPELYLPNGTLYTGENYIVKMLDDYSIRYPINIFSKEGRKITFTTAESKEDCRDGYPYRPDKERAKVYRGRNAQSDSYGFMFTLHNKAQLTMEDIVLDGGITFKKDAQGKYQRDNDGYLIIDKRNSSISSKDGVIVCMYDYGELTLGDKATLQNAYTTATNGSWGGGAICHGEISKGTKVYLKEGSEIVRCGSATYGGAISNHKNGTTYIQGGTISNCWAKKAGGAVYCENEDTNLVMTGGTITNCLAPKAGGIYLAGKSQIRMEGALTFKDNYGTDYANYNDEKNGGKRIYSNGRVRQDIYVETFRGSRPVTSIRVTGDIVAPKGSIWVWCADDHHKKGKQFAIADNGVAIRCYRAFRNARCDDATDNDTGYYLTGVSGPKIDNTRCIYWGPEENEEEGSTNVILRKVNGSYGALTGKQFKIMEGDTVVHDNLTSNSSGVFYAGELRYGTYDIVETSPAKTYTIKVTKDGVEEKEYRK